MEGTKGEIDITESTVQNGGKCPLNDNNAEKGVI
jgi:hypothetical protein